MEIEIEEVLFLGSRVVAQHEEKYYPQSPSHISNQRNMREFRIGY